MIAVVDRAGLAALTSSALRSSRCDCGLLAIDRSALLGTSRSAVIVDRQTLSATRALPGVLRNAVLIELEGGWD